MQKDFDKIIMTFEISVKFNFSLMDIIFCYCGSTLWDLITIEVHVFWTLGEIKHM